MYSKPALIKENLPELDRWHQRAGTYEEWMMSDTRALVAGPNRKVRVVSWQNIHEVCEKAGLDEQKLAAEYRAALEIGDVIFVEYEEDDTEVTDEADPGRC